MIIRIKKFKTMDNYKLYVEFDDDRRVIYDVKKDIDTLPGYKNLQNPGIFNNVELDKSRTCISWTPEADLPSDILYEYGEPVGLQKK